LFRIKEFSKFARVSPRMLRRYDEVGLFKPHKIDSLNGYRHYSAYQLPQIIKIVTYRDVGFGIKEISRLLNMEDHDILIELTKKQNEIKRDIQNQEKKIYDIDSIAESIKKEKTIMEYNVEIKKIPSCKVVSTRAIVKNYSKEIELWAMLGEYAQKNKLMLNGEPFVIYHDGEHKDENVDIEVAMPINELKENDGKFVFREVEQVESSATLLHKGPYDTIDNTFYFLAKWIEDSEYEPYGDVRQVSIKGEWNESNPNNYIVEIQMPIRKEE